MIPAVGTGSCAQRPSDRLARVDALRLATLASVVAYHCLGATAANPATASEVFGRWVEPAAWLLSVLQNEILIALSAFLFARRRRSLGRTLVSLAEVYLFWTAIYVVESLTLPTKMGVSPFGGAEFVFVLLLGGAKYHLPFLPALACCLSVVAASPTRLSPRLWGCLAIAMAYLRRAVEQLVLQTSTLDPEQMLLFQVMTVASYLPFAMLAARLGVAGGPGRRRGSFPDLPFFLLATFVLISIGLKQTASEEPTSADFLMAGRSAAIVVLLLMTLAPRDHLITLPPRFRSKMARIANLSLTIFLVHPLAIDCAPALIFHARLGARFLQRFVYVLAISFAVAWIAGEVLRTVRWRPAPMDGTRPPMSG